VALISDKDEDSHEKSSSSKPPKTFFTAGVSVEIADSHM
jgi:hypothetical protein